MLEQFNAFVATLPYDIQEEIAPFKARGAIHILEDMGISIPAAVYDEIDFDSQRTVQHDYILSIMSEFHGNTSDVVPTATMRI